MKNDILSQADVKFLVDTFYSKVIKDDVIGYIFNEIVMVNWDLHLPVMYSFWETVLFGNASYKGNPMLKHIELNKKEPLTENRFDRWTKLWEETINDNFEGKTAEEAKSKATSVKKLMLLKIQQSNNPQIVKY